MSTPPFNVAVIGYGLSAKIFHIPFILALPHSFKLHGIVQRSPKPNNNAAADFPGITIYASAEEAFADPAVSLVVLSTIPETHFPMTKAALEAGKHVVVEKPFVATSSEAQQLIDVAKRTGRLLSVYQNRRYDADFSTVAKVLKVDKSLGEVAEFHTHFDRHRPDPPADSWKLTDAPGHGAIYELGTHLIDQVYHLFGLPTKVTGIVGHQRRGVPEESSHDSCTVLMQYPGLLVTAKAGVVSCEEEQPRFWVRGTKGTFRKAHLDVQEDQLKAGLRPGDDKYGVDPGDHYGESAPRPTIRRPLLTDTVKAH
jgi:predicted dehydrogenase